MDANGGTYGEAGVLSGKKEITNEMDLSSAPIVAGSWD